MKTTKDLAEYMRRLRNAAPQQFAEFHAVFAEYTKQKTIDLINTTTDLQLAQGHAQQCIKILNVLEEVSQP